MEDAQSSLDQHSLQTSPARLLRDLPDSSKAIPTDPLPDEWKTTVAEYLKYLEESVNLRVRDIPRHDLGNPHSARVAVLFSGGIDSSVVAFLAHKHLPKDEQIDLLNVAFENPRTLQGNTQPSKRHSSKKNPNTVTLSESQKYMVPDRATGLAQLEEFRRLAPERTWNFVEINIPYDESVRFRPIIEQLMAPAKTVMDLSLAQALYFASRGIGIVRNSESDQPQAYTSTSSVILSGLGADELLGGYIRHKNAFKHAGWQGLLDELQLDVDRIHTRNLGRDDRVISSHGKEARYPFLSMTLLAHLSSVPVHLKVDPRVVGHSDSEAAIPPLDEDLLVIRGLPGDKLLHRLAARKLGLWGAAGRAKRAMQFGSRSARMEEGVSKKTKGGMELV